jgi:hypothetical protein
MSFRTAQDSVARFGKGAKSITATCTFAHRRWCRSTPSAGHLNRATESRRIGGRRFTLDPPTRRIGGRRFTLDPPTRRIGGRRFTLDPQDGRS